MTRFSAALISLTGALACGGCTSEGSSQVSGASATPSALVASAEARSDLASSTELDERSQRVSALPRESVLTLALSNAQPAEAVARYGKLVDWLARRTGHAAGDVVAHDSGEFVIGRLCDGSADLMLETVYPVVTSMAGCGAVPIAVAAKGNSFRYSATIVVRGDSKIQKLEQLGGQDVLFEDDRSTSGYLVPRLMLEQVGLSVEPSDQAARAGAVRFRFGREEMNLIGWVVHGLATSAAISDQDLAEFPGADVRVIAKSDPLPRQLVSASPSLSAEATERVRAALLDLSTAQDGGDARKAAKSAGFSPITDEDRTLLRQVGKLVSAASGGKQP